MRRTSTIEVPWWGYDELLALANLKVDKLTGLTEQEVAARREKYGLNSLPEEEPESVWQSLIEAFTDPLALILRWRRPSSAVIGLVEGKTQELQQAAWIMGIVIFMTLVSYFTIDLPATS